MGVVPGVVIDEGGPVRESCDLIAVIPPTHDDGFGTSVHPQPIVGFSVVVDDEFLAVVGGGQHDRGGGVGLCARHDSVVDEGADEVGNKDDQW